MSDMDTRSKANRKVEELKFPSPVRFQPEDRVVLNEDIQCGSLHFEAGSEGVVIQDKDTHKMGVLFKGQKNPVFGTEGKLRSQHFRVLEKCRKVADEGGVETKPMFEDEGFKKGDTVLVAGESGIIKEFSSNLQKAHVEIQTAEGPKLKLVPVSDLRSSAEANTYEIGTLLTNAAGECCLVLDGFHELIKLQPMTGKGDNLHEDGEPFTLQAADVALWKQKAYRPGDVVELVDGRYEIIDGMKASDDRGIMDEAEAREFRLGLKYGCGNPLGSIGSVGKVFARDIRGRAAPQVAKAFTELVQLKWGGDDTTGMVERFNAERLNLNHQIETLREEIAALTGGSAAVPINAAQDGPNLSTAPQGISAAELEATLKLAQAEHGELSAANNRLMEEVGKLRAAGEENAGKHDKIQQLTEDNGKLKAELLDAQKQLRVVTESRDVERKRADLLAEKNQQQSEMLTQAVNPAEFPAAASTQIANLVINAWSASPDVDPISLITPVAEIEDYAREIPAGWEYLSSYATSVVWEGRLHVTEFVTVRKAQNPFQALLYSDLSAELVIEAGNRAVVHAARAAAQSAQETSS